MGKADDDELQGLDPEEEQESAEGEDPEACEDDCKPEVEQPAKSKVKGKGKADKAPASPKPAAAPAKSTPATPAASTHLYPFNVRYAAEILDLTGFVDGQAYTGAQIKDLLIQNGFTEFADIEPEFHRSEATNTLVITIKGSKKGTGHA